MSFYRPEEPDEVSLTLCDEHDEDQREKRMSKWEYFNLFGASVNRCPDCSVERDRDYTVVRV